MNNAKNLEQCYRFGELLGQIDMHRQEIKKLEQLRLEIAKVYDKLSPQFTSLTTHIIAQEKPTESFILGIMQKLVETQSQLTYHRLALSEIETRMRIEAEMGRFDEVEKILDIESQIGRFDEASCDEKLNKKK